MFKVQGQTGERREPLDGIRGLAVLIVFLSHSSGRGFFIDQNLRLQGIGILGVYLFFVLSAWLLTTLAIDELKKSGGLNLKNFYLRRFFRIAPLYYLIVTAVFAAQEVTGTKSKEYLFIDRGLQGYLGHLLFFSGDSLFWTIPCEVFFYLTLPFIAIMYFKSPKITGINILIFIGFFSFSTVYLNYNNDCQFNFRLLDIKHKTQFLEVFLIGCFFALFSQSKGLKKYKPSNFLCLFILGLTAFLFFYTCSITCESFFGFKRFDYKFRYQTWLFGSVFASLIFLIEKRPNGFLANAFKNRVLTCMGMFGFSWYLVHFPIFHLLNLIRKRNSFFSQEVDAFWFFLSYILCFLISAILFKYVEVPGIKIGRFIEARNFKNSPKE